MLNNEVKTYLEKLDQEQKAFVFYNGEHNIAKEIKEILAKHTNYKSTDEDIAEKMAFYFRLAFTEKLGMNLRNDFAHGFGKKIFHKKCV
jgi:hypothetical protein